VGKAKQTMYIALKLQIHLERIRSQSLHGAMILEIVHFHFPFKWHGSCCAIRAGGGPNGQKSKDTIQHPCLLTTKHTGTVMLGACKHSYMKQNKYQKHTAEI